MTRGELPTSEIDLEPEVGQLDAHRPDYTARLTLRWTLVNPIASSLSAATVLEAIAAAGRTHVVTVPDTHQKTLLALLAREGRLRNAASQFNHMSLSGQDIDALVAFLRALTEDYDDA